MSLKILILSDNQKEIDFESIISHVQIERDFDPHVVYQTVVIDMINVKEAISNSNLVRQANPHVPIILVLDVTQHVDPQLLKDIFGHGPVKLYYWKSQYPDSLFTSIQSMLHPEYPTEVHSIAFVLPIFNEEGRFKHVEDFVMKLQSLLENGYLNATIHFVNDGSSDASKELIERYQQLALEMSKTVHSVQFINLHNLGKNTRKAGTYINALQKIDAKTFIFSDADNSFELDDIAAMTNIIQDGYYDMVVGTKDFTTEDRMPLRKMLSFSKRLLTKGFLPQGVYDSQTGLKAISASAAKQIVPFLHEESQLAIDLEMLYVAKKKHLRVLQLPVKCTDREGSHVNVVKDSIAFLKTLAKLRKLHRDL